jgi:hypothetical protein
MFSLFSSPFFGERAIIIKKILMFVSVMFLSFAVIDINTVNAGKKSDKKPCLDRDGASVSATGF